MHASTNGKAPGRDGEALSRELFRINYAHLYPFFHGPFFYGHHQSRIHNLSHIVEYLAFPYKLEHSQRHRANVPASSLDDHLIEAWRRYEFESCIPLV